MKQATNILENAMTPRNEQAIHCCYTACLVIVSTIVLLVLTK